MAKLIVIKGPPCAGKSTMVQKRLSDKDVVFDWDCLLYTSPSPRDYAASRMPSSA
ncbi:hypothetical protein JMUB7518_28020 [Staphylococcus aureus]